MNTYCQQIADELERLKQLGAEIPATVIEATRKGDFSYGSMAVDRLKGTEFPTATLSRLGELASREQYPKYWEEVDAQGGWQKGDSQEAYEKNVSTLMHLLSKSLCGFITAQK